MDKDKFLSWLKWLYENNNDFSLYRQEIERNTIDLIFAEVKNGSFDQVSEFKSIEKLAETETVINQCLQLGRLQDLSKEEALILMVHTLVQQKNHYLNETIKLHKESK